MSANNPPSMAARRVLLTGAAGGLGEAFARALVAAGARVALADIQAERGAQLAHVLGAQAAYFAMDMADPEAIQNGVQQAAQWLGGLDGLVNNAAITNSGGKSMQELSVQTWDEVMAVNVRGPWLASVAALPYLKASGSGRVLNIASDTALWGAPNLMAYVASKGALMAMTRSMARELGPSGICVNAIAPGLTVVEATQYVPAARHQQYLDGRAIQRPQVPQDLNAALLFLLSPASGFITGQVLPVNGGFVMP